MCGGIGDHPLGFLSYVHVEFERGHGRSCSDVAVRDFCFLVWFQKGDMMVVMGLSQPYHSHIPRAGCQVGPTVKKGQIGYRFVPSITCRVRQA